MAWSGAEKEVRKKIGLPCQSHTRGLDMFYSPNSPATCLPREGPRFDVPGASNRQSVPAFPKSSPQHTYALPAASVLAPKQFRLPTRTARRSRWVSLHVERPLTASNPDKLSARPTVAPRPKKPRLPDPTGCCLQQQGNYIRTRLVPRYHVASSKAVRSWARFCSREPGGDTEADRLTGECSLMSRATVPRP